MTATSKRLVRKITVRDWLIANPDQTAVAIVTATGLTHPAVGRALRDIRDDPTLEYIPVPTKIGGYTYRVALTVEEMKAGIRNQTLHMQTRAESMIAAGEKASRIASTLDEFALAADIKANGQMMKAQADALLSVL